MNKATISADIISSTSLDTEQRIFLEEHMMSFLSVLTTEFKNSGFYGRLIKGDYIECALLNPEDALRIALLIKSKIKSLSLEDDNENSRFKNFKTYGVRAAIGVVYLFSIYCTILFPSTPDTKILFIIFSLIACTKPSNILIKKVMQTYNIIASDTKRNNDLMNAGRLIGSLERILSYILILFNQFAVVGFIIAAKSILRFRDTDTAKTEYLLIGTLLSFGIAIILGIISINI